MSNDQQGPDAPNEPQPPLPGSLPGYGEPVGYAQPAGYAEPVGYAQPGQYSPPPPTATDGLSIAALVTGILGLGVVPIVLGIFGLKRTKANGTSGRGFAIAGIVLGGIGIVVWVVAIAIGLLAFLGLNAAETDSTAGDSVVAPTSESTSATEDTSGSVTPLLDLAPLDVAGFTTEGFVPEFELVKQGALESYTASYTDGTSTVDAVLNDWPTEELGQAWAATQDAKFTPDQLTDSGEAGDGVVYRVYEVGDVTTVVATNYTAALTLTGPYDAVVALYQEFPL